MGVSPELLLPALHSLHYQQLVPGGAGSGPELPFGPESHCLKVLGEMSAWIC